MSEVSRDRWMRAQQAEAAYWQGVRKDDVLFLRIAGEKAAAAAFLLEHASDALSATKRGTAVEVGIGPFGIGVISLLPWSADWLLIGVEPLPLVAPPASRLTAAMCEAVQELPYQHVRGVGEHMPLRSGVCDLAVCHNVLEHVLSPREVLSELCRTLRPGAHLLLGEDARSAGGAVKMRYYTRVVRRASFMVTAHPHSFTAAQLEGMAREAGLQIVAAERPARSLMVRLRGRARRHHVVCRKA
jgi:SAM-dependent methyltransferase